ncbi:chloramphenicol O-acetyltransferase [Clostridiales bacterium oral taxon 876 str. F0540]|nr:chloramphenicol O-acetyltransferase [Clostridiales bacterium oral taxon 876 str. F0540]
MKFIDVESWNRKNHYNYFKELDYPHFSICGNLDITKFHKYIKENKIPFFVAVLYASIKTANSIKEFKYRIREDKVIEHDTISPSFTVMTEGEIFSFCTSEFTEEFKDFRDGTYKEIEKVKSNISIEDEPGRDDLIYVTSIPWISFTNITHPIQMKPVDSIPRISWGKYFEDNGKIKLPLSVQAHHALVDGVHVGQFFNNLQEIFNNPINYI